jgi:GntR family transcriptional repressor for pyruvate dehydrogenase complex
LGLFKMEYFRPIKKTTISGEIIDQIISMVRSGRLNRGEKLPSERQLSGFFNVGRSSIREALKALETIGITQRTKEGTIICDSQHNFNSFFWLDSQSSTIHEVFETRKLMEIGLVGLAAERATPNHIKEIEEALVDTVAIQEAVAPDVSFHRALVNASQNSVFSKVYDLITGLLFQTHKYYSLLDGNQDLEGYLKIILAQHKKILRAVEIHDAVSAREAIKEHLDFAEKELLGRVSLDYSKEQAQASSLFNLKTKD